MKRLLYVLAAFPAPAQIPSPFAIGGQILREGGAYDATALMRRLDLPAKYDFESGNKWFKPEYPTTEIHPYIRQV